MKHVKAAERAIEVVRKEAEELAESKYRLSCWRFERRAVATVRDAISRVHVTDPHPK